MVILWGVPLNVRDTTTLLRLHSQFSTSATNTAPILHCMSQLLIPSAEVDIGRLSYEFSKHHHPSATVESWLSTKINDWKGSHPGEGDKTRRDVVLHGMGWVGRCCSTRGP